MKFESRFNEIGINIHNPKYGAWIETSTHKQDAYGYNQKWQTFWEQYDNAGILPSKEDVLNYIQEIKQSTTTSL